MPTDEKSPSPQRSGTRPSDTEELMGDTATSRKLTESDEQRVQPSESESRPRVEPSRSKDGAPKGR